MKVLLDTNVVLDVALENPGLYEESLKILEWCEQGNPEVTLVAFHTYTNVYYLLRAGYKKTILQSKSYDKSDRSETAKAVQEASVEADQDAKDFLLDLASWTRVAPVSDTMIVEGLNREGDFEDTLQCLSAKEGGADVLVTRDKIACEIRTVLPGDFIDEFIAPEEKAEEVRKLVDSALRKGVIERRGSWNILRKILSVRGEKMWRSG